MLQIRYRYFFLYLQIVFYIFTISLCRYELILHTRCLFVFLFYSKPSFRHVYMLLCCIFLVVFNGFECKEIENSGDETEKLVIS